MTNLTQLLNSTAGIDFLHEHGIFTNLSRFLARLKRPLNDALLNYLQLHQVKPIYTHQQLYLDYRRSVLSKLQLLRQCSQQREDIFPFFLWIDTDRSESDKLSTRLYWPMRDKQYPIKITPPGTKDVESRFVRLRSRELQAAIDKLGAYVAQTVRYKKRAQPKFEQLNHLFQIGQQQTLSEFNHMLTSFLFDDHLAFNPYSVILSHVVNHDLLTAAIDRFINQIEAVIHVFNDTIHELQQQGIDVPVRPLPENYLPLHFTCDTSQKRIRLRHVVDGNDHFAVGQGKKRTYRFYLGHRDALSISEVAQTDRWSPDVFVPLFFNDLVSGFVAGKSSALYSLVMNEVLRQVFKKRPVPILVPQALAHHQPKKSHADSLLYDYLNS